MLIIWVAGIKAMVSNLSEDEKMLEEQRRKCLLVRSRVKYLTVGRNLCVLRLNDSRNKLRISDR